MLFVKGLLAGSCKRGFHPNSDRFTMIVDSDASDHSIDEELIPKLRKIMKEYKTLQELDTIVTNGNEKVIVVATGTIWGYIIGQAGNRSPVRISAMVVLGLGRSGFSSIKAMQQGVNNILETENRHLQFDRNISLPLIQHQDDKGVFSNDALFCTLGSTTGTPSTPALVPAA